MKVALCLLSVILVNVNNIFNRTVANYIIWTFVSDSTSVGAFLDINLRYQQVSEA